MSDYIFLLIILVIYVGKYLEINSDSSAADARILDSTYKGQYLPKGIICV